MKSALRNVQSGSVESLTVYGTPQQRPSTQEEVLRPYINYSYESIKQLASSNSVKQLAPQKLKVSRNSKKADSQQRPVTRSSLSGGFRVEAYSQSVTRQNTDSQMKRSSPKDTSSVFKEYLQQIVLKGSNDDDDNIWKGLYGEPPKINQFTKKIAKNDKIYFTRLQEAPIERPVHAAIDFDKFTQKDYRNFQQKGRSKTAMSARREFFNRPLASRKQILPTEKQAILSPQNTDSIINISQITESLLPQNHPACCVESNPALQPGTFEYKVKHRIQEESYYTRFDFMNPEWKDQIQKHLKGQDRQNHNVFDICSKSTHDRTPLEVQFLNTYMQTKFDVFNSIQSEQQLSRILSKLQPLQCRKGDYLLKQGSQADFLVILVEGTVSIQIRARTIMQRKAPDLIGENALKSNETRSADVVADTDAKVLLLYRQSYMSALSDFEYELQETYYQAMRKSEVTKEWIGYQIQGYSMVGKKITIDSGQTLYQISDPAECVYFVLSGQVDLELNYIVQNVLMLPVSIKGYQKKIQNRLVRRVVRECKYSDQFGFEEVVTLRKTRVITARAVGKTPATLLYIARDKFREFNSKQDIQKLIKFCEPYTDYQHIGCKQYEDLNHKKREVEQFLNAIDINNLQINERSQDTPNSWLGPTFNSKNQKKMSGIKKYVKNIKDAADLRNFSSDEIFDRHFPTKPPKKNKRGNSNYMSPTGFKRQLSQISAQEVSVQANSEKKQKEVSNTWRIINRQDRVEDLTFEEVQILRFQFKKLQTKGIKVRQQPKELIQTDEERAQMAELLLSLDQKDLPIIPTVHYVDELQLKVKLITTAQEMNEFMLKY